MGGEGCCGGGEVDHGNLPKGPLPWVDRMLRFVVVGIEKLCARGLFWLGCGFVEDKLEIENKFTCLRLTTMQLCLHH